MSKLLKLLMFVFISTISTCIISCSDNDEPETVNISSETKSAIASTFSGLRLDSITSNEVSYGNIKIEYEKNLLISYKRCRANGNIEDGVNFTFTWTIDTVYIQCGVDNYKAVIGENGLIANLICPNGKTNNYTFNESNQLISYNYDTVSGKDDEKYVLTWEDGNVTVCRKWLRYDGETNLEYYDYFFQYTDTPNVAGILPSCYNSYTWISDEGRSVRYDINKALYYAGLLGAKTNNLVSSSYQIVYGGINKGKKLQSLDYEYTYDEKGYVTEVSYNQSNTPALLQYK